MKRTKLICAGAGAALVFLAGCRSTPSPAAKAPEAAPQTIIAPVVAPVSGTDLDQANLEKVRVGETLKSYPVGRYLDPQDSNVMHEAHVVYRKEAGSSWNLYRKRRFECPLDGSVETGATNLALVDMVSTKRQSAWAASRRAAVGADRRRWSWTAAG